MSFKYTLDCAKKALEDFDNIEKHKEELKKKILEAAKKGECYIEISKDLDPRIKNEMTQAGFIVGTQGFGDEHNVVTKEIIRFGEFERK